MLACVEVLPAATVFDVGANVGAFSLIAGALTSADIVGFEPTPDLARTFEQLARLNRLDCIQVERLALGATDGEATLYLSDRTDSSNSLGAGFRPSHASVQIPLERLDTYVARTGRRPRLLKIDTESTEPDVLREAVRYLASDRPWIVCEVLAGRTEGDLMAILGPLGYRYHELRDGPGPAIDTIAGDPTYRLLDCSSPQRRSRSSWATEPDAGSTRCAPRRFDATRLVAWAGSDDGADLRVIGLGLPR